MIPAGFDYVRARSLEHALDLLEMHGDGAALLAGGHSLVPLLKLRLARPRVLIDVGRLQLADVLEDRVGALVTHATVAGSTVVPAALAACAGHIGDRQVRARGTLGGALAHNDPAGDYPAAILALEGQVRLLSRLGWREVPAAEFFRDAFTTALEPHEILTEVLFPWKPERGVYLKSALRGSGYALCGVCVAASPGKVRVGITGVAGCAFRARAVEEALAIGASPAEASLLACEGVEAVSDGQASGDYRAHLARVMTRRALEQCGFPAPGS